MTIRATFVGCALWFVLTGRLTAQEATELGRIDRDQLQYIGAFRVPRGQIGDSSFSYGGTAYAFNPENNSLFIVGHAHQQAIAEVAVQRRSKTVRSKNWRQQGCCSRSVAYCQEFPECPLKILRLVDC